MVSRQPSVWIQDLSVIDKESNYGLRRAEYRVNWKQTRIAQNKREQTGNIEQIYFVTNCSELRAHYLFSYDECLLQRQRFHCSAEKSPVETLRNRCHICFNKTICRSGYVFKHNAETRTKSSVDWRPRLSCGLLHYAWKHPHTCITARLLVAL